METKVCCHCKVKKTLDQFYKRIDYKQGVSKTCIECDRLRAKARRLDPIKKVGLNRSSRKYYQKIRQAAFDAYGNCCACCGETDPAFLTIDHINRDGAKHRKETNGAAVKIYRWLKANNYPEGFQVLCYNCNCASYRNSGVCPHKMNEVAYE